MKDAGDMGGMITDREFFFNDPADHRASPDAGIESIGHRTAVENVGKGLVLFFGETLRASRSVPFQHSLETVFLPTAQPQANFRTMDSKKFCDFRCCLAFHVKRHGMQSRSHPIGSFAQRLLAEINQLFNSFSRSMYFDSSHGIPFRWNAILSHVALFMQ